MYYQRRCSWCDAKTDKTLKIKYLSDGAYGWLMCDKCTEEFKHKHKEDIEIGYITEDDEGIYTPDSTWIKCQQKKNIIKKLFQRS